MRFALINIKPKIMQSTTKKVIPIVNFLSVGISMKITIKDTIPQITEMILQ